MFILLLCIGLIIGIVCMEFLSYIIHRFIMHGFLWNIHKTHHKHGKNFFELNDVFSLFFALVSMCLSIVGYTNGDYFLFGIGFGIIIYGFLYFFIHDILIHKRVKISIHTKNRYIQHIIHAHKIHHSTIDKFPSQSFGLLWVPYKYRKNRGE